MKRFFRKWKLNSHAMMHTLRDLSAIGLLVIIGLMMLSVIKHMFYFKAYLSFLFTIEKGLSVGWLYFGHIMIVSLVIFISTLIMTYRDNWYGR